MFEHGFPPYWSTLKKLIWLVGAGVAGGAVWRTITGAIVRFIAKKVTPIEELKVAIEPVQSGSGDPSPDNVRPITGWTGCNIYHTGTNICDLADAGIGTKSLYNLSSGTISIGGSGATLSGTNPIEITNTTTWRGAVFFSKPMKSGQQCKIRYRITGTSVSNIKRTTYIVDKNNSIVSKVSNSSNPDHDVNYVYTQNVTAISDGDKAVLVVESANKQTITIYDLSFNYPSTDTSYHAYSGTTYPISWQTEAGSITSGTLTVAGDGGVTLTSGGNTYQLASITPISTIAGENNIWTDAGDVTVTAAGIKEITPSSAQALNMLLGGMYTNNHTPDDVSDDEALDIILGGSNA